MPNERYVYPRKIDETDLLVLPSGPPDTRYHPEHYCPGADLENAVNASILLRKPLLLTGEAGVGKTELAYHLAWAMRLHDPLVFQAKTTSVANELFYTVDEIGRFRSRDDLEDKMRYLRFRALGEAIIGSHSPSTINPILSSKLPVWAPSQSVVLIDEIDKAPRDFPNDILRELDKLEFEIPEMLDASITANREYRPIVVITSNSERSLPAPFLRRCIYCHLAYPDDSSLLNIVLRRMPSVISDAKRIEPLVKLFLEIRGLEDGLSRLPSTAELLDWLHFLNTAIGLNESALKSNSKLFISSSSCLGKSEDDIYAIEGVLRAWIVK